MINTTSESFECKKNIFIFHHFSFYKQLKVLKVEISCSVEFSMKRSFTTSGSSLMNKSATSHTLARIGYKYGQCICL